MPVFNFDGESNNYRLELHTEVVSNISDLEDKLKLLWEDLCGKSSYSSNRPSMVGLDTEMTFGSILESKLATLQLCTERHCVIIQLPQMESIPICLQNFLALPDVTFAGVGIKDSVARLVKEYGLECRKFVELSSLAASVNHRSEGPKLGSYGLVDLVTALGLDFPVVHKPWSVLTTDWGSLELTQDQIKCAAWDAFASYRVARSLTYFNC